MKIRLSFGRLKLFIWCPHCLFFNHIAALVIFGILKEKGVYISEKSIYTFLKSFKNELKSYKKLTVLQIDTVSGFELTVRL